MVAVALLGYSRLRGKQTYVLGSVAKNWFAMLRSVKRVPGLAEKIVPSETRLSEQPMNINGGAGEARGLKLI